MGEPINVCENQWFDSMGDWFCLGRPRFVSKREKEERGRGEDRLGKKREWQKRWTTAKTSLSKEGARRRRGILNLEQKKLYTLIQKKKNYFSFSPFFGLENSIEEAVIILVNIMGRQ